MQWYKIIATSLGVGYSPIAPGTMGAILGTILFYALNLFLLKLNFSWNYVILVNVIAIIFFLLLGVKAIKNVHKIWKHDDNRIVIDEVAGVWVTALFVPVQWKYYLLALIVFRFFDIVKPLGIKNFDRMKNDLSVMLDDLLAGFYGWLLIQILLFFKLI